MDLLEEDALRRELSQFRRSKELYPHPSHALGYTEGVKFLAVRCHLSWLIDVIAAWQPRALRDRDLAFYQLWELQSRGKRRVVVCSKDSEREAFRFPVGDRDSELDYISLYVEGGVLMLPSEHSRRAVTRKAPR